MSPALGIRASSPIATRREVSLLTGAPAARLTAWTAQRTEREPLVHTIRGGRFTFPLVGIAEAAALNALREAGMSMQEARKAGEYIRSEYGDDYAIASPRLVTDGTAAYIEDRKGLMRLRDRQQAFKEVVKDHLRPLIIGPDGVVEAFRVDRLTETVTIDPRFNAGRMSFARTRLPVFAPLGELLAGEKPDAVRIEYDLTASELKDLLTNTEWLAEVA